MDRTGRVGTLVVPLIYVHLRVLFARNCHFDMITCYTLLYTVSPFNLQQIYRSDNYPRINYPIFSLSENYPLSADNKKSDKRPALASPSPRGNF